jgi:prevent-host-death family protein
MEHAPDVYEGMQGEEYEEVNLGPEDDRLAQLVERARETKRAVIVMRDGKPVAAIMDFGQLAELEQLVDDLDAKAIALEYEAQDARGEVEYLTHEEMLAFQDKLIAEAAKRVANRSGADSEVAGE